jgi:hypothetical protein
MRIFHVILMLGALALVSPPVRGQQKVAPAARDMAAVRAVAPRVLPGTRASAFATIHGNALNSANVSLPDVPIRLRDARFGGIVAEQRTDRSGLFTFQPVDPGSYVAELIGDRGAVLAASDIINIASSETASAIVQLPVRVPVGIMSSRGGASLLAIISSASAAGVLVTSPTVDVSEDRPRVR